MQRISIWLWGALAGAVLQFVALGSNFYVIRGGGEATSDAWLGLPHASDLILASALVTVLATAAAAAGRVPVTGRRLGLLVGVAGALATAQLAYRMAVPPFGCLTYSCGSSAKADVTLLAGIWIGLAGCLLALAGGFGHAFSGAARRTSADPVIAGEQTGMTPWLGLNALGLLVAFVAPFTVFDAYRVEGFAGARGSATWGGWLSLPHTSSLVLACAGIAIGLVLAAGRRRAPLSPAALGAALGVLAFVVAARELFRIAQTPFSTAGGATNVPVGAVDILPAFWVGFAGAAIALVAAIIQTVLYPRDSAALDDPVAAASMGRAHRAAGT